MIDNNIAILKNQINDALKKSNKKDLNRDIKLIAVTKNQDIQAMREAIDAGINAIGENRVQEALSKYSRLERHPEWHLIGHLQTNKVKTAVKLFDLIHSVDSERLAVEINKAAGSIGKRQDILMQVNIACEETKFGIREEETLPLAKVISALPNIQLCGLMVIAPYFENQENARPIFRRGYQLFKELQNTFGETKIKYLSMGMSNDFTVAIEEGANIVRIGTFIFGERKYH